MKRIDTTLKIALAIQIAILSIISLDFFGLQIPILRETIGFIYLTFIPGVLLLKILKFRELDPVDSLLYSVGLSIAFIVTMGLLANDLYPVIGIMNPISFVPLMSTISVFVLVLCGISYLRSESSSQPIQMQLTRTSFAPALFLCLIPFFSILGTLLVASHQSNILLLISIAMVPITAILIVCNKFVPKELCPVAVVAIALALFYQFTLISPYLTGADIHLEYYFSKLVINNSLWAPAIANIYNGMASVVILCPVYSVVLSMDSAWVLKIIYPILFSLVPLGLYRIFQKQMNDRVAFLSVFFFMSFFAFFTELMALARQQIAELFFVLLILLIVDKNIMWKKGVVLCITFAALLAVSHYGLSYLFMLFFLVAPWMLLVLLRNSALSPLFQRIRNILRIDGEISAQFLTPFKYRILTGTFITFFACLALSWYLYVSNSSALGAFAYAGRHIFSSIYTDLFTPGSRGQFVLQALGGGLQVETWQQETYRAIQYVTEAFIVVGVLKLIWKPAKVKLNPEFFAMTLCGFGLILASIVLPYFASSLNMTRIYEIALFFLSPACIIGGMTLFESAVKVFRRRRDRQLHSSSGAAVFLLSLVLTAYFLFNTGFIQEVTGSVPFSISLNPERMETSINSAKISFNIQYTFESEVFSACWLSKMRSPTSKIYADDQAIVHVLASYGMIATENSATLSNDTRNYYGDTYIYLRRLNVVDGLMTTGPAFVFNTSQITPVLDSMNKIYSNGESDIYRSIEIEP